MALNYIMQLGLVFFFVRFLVIELNVLYSATVFELESDQM